MSYSDYIYQERLRDVVDTLKADLALATAREVALRKWAIVPHRRKAVGYFDSCRICGEWWCVGRCDDDDCDHSGTPKHARKCLLADQDPAAERLLRELEVYRRAVGGAWCQSCMEGDHSSQDSGYCGNDNRFSADCRCYHPEHSRQERWRLLRIEAAAKGLRDVAKRANSEPPGTDESFSLLRAGIDAEAALYAALADMEANRG